MSSAKGTRRSTSRVPPSVPAPPGSRSTRTSHQLPPRRSARPKGRLSSSSLASTTAGPGSRGMAARLTQIGPSGASATGTSVSGSTGGKASAGSSVGGDVQPPLGGAPLDEHVAQGGRAGRRRRQDGAAQGPRPGTGLDDDEHRRLAEGPPLLVQHPGDDRAEEGPDLGAGDEVTLPAPRAAADLVEAGLGVVQRPLDHPPERHGPVAADVVGDPGGGGGGGHGRGAGRGWGWEAHIVRQVAAATIVSSMAGREHTQDGARRHVGSGQRPRPGRAATTATTPRRAEHAMTSRPRRRRRGRR